MDIKDHIRSIPDFPKPGILFYDISTLLAHADAFSVAMGRLAKAVSRHTPDVLAGIELRGFLVAAPLALKLGLGFVMVRKRGKLPGRTVRHEYALEYGSDVIEIQNDAIVAGPARRRPRRPVGDRRDDGSGNRPVPQRRRRRRGRRLHHRADLPQRAARTSTSRSPRWSPTTPEAAPNQQLPAARRAPGLPP